MLNSIQIGSFRGLTDVELSDLRPVNILVGENNSGKTSVLEAILLANQPGNTQNWFQILQARDSAWNSQTFGELARWLFPVVDRDHLEERAPIHILSAFDGIGEALQLTFEKRVTVEIVEGRRQGEPFSEEEELTTSILNTDWASSEIGGKSGQIVFKQVPSTRKQTVAVRIDPELQRIPARRGVFVKPHAHRFGRYATESLSSAIKSGEKKAISDFMTVFDPDLEGIDIVQDRFGTSVFVQHRTMGPMPIHAFGDGLRKAVVVAGMAFEAQDGLLLIDEAEVAIHFTCQEAFFGALFRLCQRLNVQLILTTHSLDAVDGVISSMNENLEDLAAFHLPDRGSGQSIKRLSGDIMKRLRFERGLDLR